jgi:hypothetical protein
MELHGEMIRRADPVDKRRAFIEISDEAFEAMRATLLAAELRPVGTASAARDKED